MYQQDQKVHVYVPDSVNKNGVILERIQRDYGVVYSVKFDDSDVPMVVNESQLISRD